MSRNVNVGHTSDLWPLRATERCGMVSRMKTTIDIAEPLLNRAKQVVVAEGVTLRELVEDGLRRVIEERAQRGTFRLRRATFRGNGLQPDVAEESGQRVRDLAYEGRGA